MDDIITTFGNVFIAAFVTSVAVQMLKSFPLKRWSESEYFSIGIWALTIAGGIVITWIFQGLGLILDGWRVTVVAGIFTAGLAMLGYEGVKKVWVIIRGGDSTGRDTVNIQDVRGEHIDIGGG